MHLNTLKTFFYFDHKQLSVVDCIYVCQTAHLGCAGNFSQGVRANYCEGSSPREKLSLWAASLLWGLAAEHLFPPDQTSLQGTLGLLEVHCSVTPFWGHSDIMDDSCAQHNMCFSFKFNNNVFFKAFKVSKTLQTFSGYIYTSGGQSKARGHM